MHLIGSSRLGLDISGSDLDLVVVGNIARPMFFDYAVKVLSSQDSVADLRVRSEKK
jgi:poly(A) polymerase Pap1